MPKVTATEFKARCLALIDEVERTGEPLTITKRGRPVAQVVPLRLSKGSHPFEALKGTLEIVGDILEPALPPESWDAEHGATILTADERIIESGLTPTLS